MNKSIDNRTNQLNPNNEEYKLNKIDMVTINFQGVVQKKLK